MVVNAESALLKMSPMENAAIGVGAGTMEVCALQPMLYWKNATQQGLPLTLNPRLLYRGLSTSVINMATLTGLQFPLTGAVSKVITGGADRDLGNGEKILAAFAGGFLSGFACGPFELTMIQQQRFGGSLFGTPARLVTEHGGPSAMGRGLLMSCGREGIYTAGVLGTCPVFTAKLSVVAIVCRVIYFPLYYANVDLLRTYAFTIWFFCCALLMGAPLYPEIVPFFEPNKTRQ